VIAQPKEEKEQIKFLVDKHGWEKDQVDKKKLWAYGPDGSGPNWFMEACEGVQYLSEIRESCNSGFQWATNQGPLCQ